MCFPTSIVGEEIRCYPLPPLICCALVKPSSMHAEYNELHSTTIPLLSSVDNGPVGWLFTVRFLVTAESIECG